MPVQAPLFGERFPTQQSAGIAYWSIGIAEKQDDDDTLDYDLD